MPTLKIPAGDMYIEAFGFDVDGVLRNMGLEAFINCRLAIKKLGGLPPSFEDFVHDWSGHLIEYYRSCGVTASREEIERVNKGYIAGHDIVAPFEDVVPVLVYLGSLGIPMFALSGHAQAPLNDWFAKHNLHVHFAYVQGDGRDKMTHLAALCANLGVVPSAGCYLGDWGQDMRAATAASMIPIGVTRSLKSHEVLKRNGAVHVIDHLAELQDLVF